MSAKYRLNKMMSSKYLQRVAIDRKLVGDGQRGPDQFKRSGVGNFLENVSAD